MAKAIVPAMFAVSFPETSHSRDIKKVIGVLFLVASSALVIILIVKSAVLSHKNNDTSVLEASPTSSSTTSDVTALPPVDPESQAPPFSGLALHPYELLKNPYKAKGKLVTLNLNTMPVLLNGAAIQYSGSIDPAFGMRLGLMALRLDRMADESTALYSIMGMEAGSSTGQVLGQIAVELPQGTTELRLDREWMVEPMVPMSGTNYLGAEVQIPSVRFWRYVGNNGKSTFIGQKATAFPNSSFHYKKYLHGYMADEFCSTVQKAGPDDFCYSFNWQPWIKELESKTAGGQADALLADTGTASPGNLVISWDAEQRVVFSGFRPHFSTDASAYVIVAPRKRELDIVWQRGDKVTYLGPNAALLRDAHVYEWLQKVGF